MMNQPFDIVTIGSAVKDVFYTMPEGLIEKGSFKLRIGAKISIEDIKEDIGGGATNTAVAFARLGYHTGCVCKVGSDAAADDILDCLQKEGISFLGAKGKKKSGISIILHGKTGRTILVHKGESDTLRKRDVKAFETTWLYLSSMLGKSFQTQLSLAKKCAKKGTRIAFNPSSYLITQKNLSGFLKIVEILVINKEEAQDLEKRYKKPISELGPRTVVITNKDEEILCYHESKRYTLQPNRRLKVVERTGAGDAFAAGFVAGRMKNWPIQKCLELGLEEGEAVLKHFGAKNNLIRRKMR